VAGVIHCWRVDSRFSGPSSTNTRFLWSSLDSMPTTWCKYWHELHITLTSSEPRHLLQKTCLFQTILP